MIALFTSQVLLSSDARSLRKQDMDRHVMAMHIPEENQVQYYCRYNWCVPALSGAYMNE